MSIIKKSLVFIVFICCLTNCQAQNNSDDRASIYALIIDKISHLPPPSPEIMMDKKLSKKYIDSVGKIKQNIGLINKTKIFSYEYSSVNNEYLNILAKLNSVREKKKITVEQINVLSKNEIKSLNSFKKPEEINVTCIVNFSDIIFNNEKNKAVVYFSNYRGRLAGSTVLYLLHKTEEGWIINDNILISIS